MGSQRRVSQRPSRDHGRLSASPARRARARGGWRRPEGRARRRNGEAGRPRVLELHPFVRQVLVLHRRPTDDVRATRPAALVHARRDGAAQEKRQGPASLPHRRGIRDAHGAPGAERHPHPEGRAPGRRVPRELRRARGRGTGLQSREGAAGSERRRVGLRRCRPECHSNVAADWRGQDHRGRRDEAEARVGGRVRRHARPSTPRKTIR
jgi:hypothetical protein